MSVAQKKTKRHVTKNFGRDADVVVTGEESTYKGLKGRVVNGTLNMNGTYLVALGLSHGDQFIHANDLDLEEDVPAAAAPPVRALPPQEIPLVAIHPDPNQPRKTIDAVGLEELAGSIRTEGVMQAILVRPHETLPEGEYMIVFGERRWRASLIAGAETIPANVREFSDDRTLEMQVIENLQREDVHPIHEAHAFNTMHQRGLTTEEIGHRIGKGKTYVRTRLRLCSLTEAWQQIYLEGHINFEEAGQLSKASAAVQDEILAEASKRFKPGQAGWQISNLAYQLRNSERSLKAAIFDIADPQLYPEMGACTSCPFNSSVNELFSEEGPAVCNNPGCYAIKTDRGYALQLKAVAAQEDVVLVSHYAYSAADQARLKMAEELGQEVLKNDAVMVVERTAEPTIDLLAARYSSLKEDALERMFKSTHKAWQDAQDQIAEAKQDGRLKRAFIVAGNNPGTYQDVIIAKPPEPSTQTGAIGKGIRALLNNNDEERGVDPKRVRAAATGQYHKLLRGEADFFECRGILADSEEAAFIIYLWGQAWMNDDDSLKFIQERYFVGQEEVFEGSELELFNLVAAMHTGMRMDIMGDLARLLFLPELSYHKDYEEDGEAAAVRTMALEVKPGLAREIDAEVMIKLQADA